MSPDDVAALDAEAFGCDRSELLARLLEMAPDYARVAEGAEGFVVAFHADEVLGEGVEDEVCGDGLHSCQSSAPRSSVPPKKTACRSPLPPELPYQVATVVRRSGPCALAGSRPDANACADRVPEGRGGRQAVLEAEDVALNWRDLGGTAHVRIGRGAYGAGHFRAARSLSG